MDTIIAPGDVVARLGVLSDVNRLRILALLDRNEFAVSELMEVLQLPQSTVSRHLKVLADDALIRSRQDGTSRHYRLAGGEESRSGLWSVVRELLEGAPWMEEDAERAAPVLSRRMRRAEEFFSGAAEEWDTLRSKLFGSGTEQLALLGLMDPSWTIGDLGSGTGAFAEMVSPFVRSVVAVDRSPEMLAASRSRLHDRANVEHRQGELESLPLDSGSLDLAVMLLVLHYVVDPALALAEACRCLRPGGRLLLVDMREHSRDEYRETMGHLWTGFSPAQLEEWANAAGFGEWRWSGLPPTPGAAGPLLFMGTGLK